MKNIYVRLLQYLVGTDVDGDWGPASCAAADQLIGELSGMAGDFIKYVVREEVQNDGKRSDTVLWDAQSPQQHSDS